VVKIVQAAERSEIAEIDDFMIARLPLPENPEIWRVCRAIYMVTHFIP
jgi:hypothetical protein